MNFSHLVTEEIKELEPKTSPNFKGGLCRCKVVKAEEGVSGAGNEQLVLDIKAIDMNKEHAEIKIFLPFIERMMWKVKHFCEATKMEDEWYSMEVSAGSCSNKMFEAVVIIEKSDNDKFPDKWKIKHFVATERYETFKDGKKPFPNKKDSFKDDDIPF